MKKITLLLALLLITMTAFPQAAAQKKSGGKQNSLASIGQGKGARSAAMEGDGTGDRISGRKNQKKNPYGETITNRQKFSTRKYKLKSAGGEPIKPTR